MEAVVFSRDRALQLEAALDSLATHCVDVRSLCMLHVLFTGSTERYARQYEQLKRLLALPFPVAFHHESSFRHDLLSLLRIEDATSVWRRRLPLGLAGRLESLAARRPATAPWDYLLLLVDDNVFVRPFSLADTVRALQQRERAVGFSLRLGRNVVYCHPQDEAQTAPPLSHLAPGVFFFDWPGADCDFGYPMDVSSSVYPSESVAGLLATLDYANPNTLEDALARAARRLGLADRLPELCCFDRSVTFCNAVNRVQVAVRNRAGESVHLPAEALADLFDQGLRIDTRTLAGYTPDGCHCEVPFSFVPRANGPM